ncbi:hypothetical protein [Campylobacter mucosalis]|uniref:Uncharacterized protein n=1 Tax=Campylobacter mucosalis CCUG 21559 TaxID=1032067 RepID=A0A6G5QE24_9BACT|nr:hypothetical protein [Campylobacter mucosalis]QCD43935.1 hypothetical protein CMUC_0115 [Campylobacter mucosalis CCUG 21559]
MSEIRLIPAELKLEFERDGSSDESFAREFNAITQNDEDPLGAWLKRAKAKGETKDSDQVLLTLVTELHRKFDELNERLSGKTKDRIKLTGKADIDSVGFEYIHSNEDVFDKDDVYYGRIALPIFPKRVMAIYLYAIDTKTCKITKMHEDDESDWNAYVTARERVMIRQIRANS